MKYKYIENGIITYIGESDILPIHAVEINDEEEAKLTSAILRKPEDTLQGIYRLSAETNQYEEFPRIYEETVQWYMQKVDAKEMTVEEVPTDYKMDVEALLPNNAYGLDNDTYNTIIDDYTLSLMDSGLL